VSRLYGTKDHYRGYSPAMVAYNGSTYFMVRVANYTKCPYWAGVDAYKLQPPFHTQASVQPAGPGPEQPGPLSDSVSDSVCCGTDL